MTKRIGALIVVAPDQARAEILAALDAAKGNRTHAAEALGVSLSILKRWIVALDLYPAIDKLCEEKGHDVHPGASRKPRAPARKPPRKRQPK